MRDAPFIESLEHRTLLATTTLGTWFDRTTLIGVHNTEPFVISEGLLYRGNGSPENAVRIRPPKDDAMRFELNAGFDGPWYDYRLANSRRAPLVTAIDAERVHHLFALDLRRNRALKLAPISNQSEATEFDGLFIFTHSDRTLWRTDGTVEGTFRLTNQPSLARRSFATLGGKVYFSSSTGSTYDARLWQTDGTFAGTSAVRTIENIDFGDISTTQIASTGSRLFVGSEEGVYSVDPARSSATRFAETSGYVSGVVTVGDDAVFTVSVGEFSELWAVYGSSANAEHVDSLIADSVRPTSLQRTSTHAFMLGISPRKSSAGIGLYAFDPIARTLTRLAATPYFRIEGERATFQSPSVFGARDETDGTPNGTRARQFESVVTDETGFYSLGVGGGELAGAMLRRTAPGVRPLGQISGTVFNDEDADGIRDVGELPQPGVRFYVDTNGNARLDADEPFARSDAKGRWAIHQLRPGSYSLRMTELDTEQWRATKPVFTAIRIRENRTSDAGAFSNHFIDRPAVVQGAVVNGDEFSSNFTRPGLGGFRIFADLDNDGFCDPTEPQTRSAQNGRFTLNFDRLAVATIRITEAAGWRAKTTAAVERVVTQSVPNFVTFSMTRTVLISGRAFIDENGNGRPDETELGVSVYLDQNKNGVYDAGERESAYGGVAFVLGGLPGGSYRVGIRSGFLYEVAEPANGFYQLELYPGQVASGLLFILMRIT